MRRHLAAIAAAASVALIAAAPGFAQDPSAGPVRADAPVDAIQVTPPNLDDLFEDLQTASTEGDAAFIAEEIETLWREEGGPTAEVLVTRALEAAELGETDIARTLVDGALDLSPDYAWGWAQSALISFAESEHVAAIAAIEHALELEPRHYEALFGLGSILEALERWDGAYAAYERALEIYPLHADARARLDEIAPRARGRDL